MFGDDKELMLKLAESIRIMAVLLIAMILLEPGLTGTPLSTGAIAAPTGERRIALVIGNGAYQYPDNLPALPNPVHDAEDIAEALRGFGFEVIERKNQTLEGMNQTIADFGSRIGGSDAALFYFAGHGIQVKNQNYLMPVDAKIDSEAAVPYKGINVNQILDEMDNGKSRANIVMLDACRNNPISGKFRSGKARGLASPGFAPKGTVIVYATDPGNTAADGDGRNGIFTAGLLTAFKGKDLSLDGVLTVASEEVDRASGKTQTPYINGPKLLQKSFHFRVTVDPGRGEIEKTFWTSIERSSDVADFEAYLRKYPKGSYRELAENQIRRLKASSKPATPAPVAAPQPAALSVVLPVAPAKSEDPETQFWNEVKASGAGEYLDAYLKQYPKGKYVSLARIELKKLDERKKAEEAREKEEQRQAAEKLKAEQARKEAAQKQAAEQLEAKKARAEQEAWEQAKSDNTSAAYANFQKRYPGSQFVALAQAAQQKIVRETAEREKQEAARKKSEALKQEQLAQEAAERKKQAAEEKAKEEAARPSASVVDVAKTRFTATANGTISDSQTGLEWVVGPDKDTNYAQAEQWVAACTVAGGGLRMPTKAELKILYQKGIGTRNMDLAFKTTGWWVWGESRDSSSAWRFGFFDGNEGWLDRSGSNNGRVFGVWSRPR